MRVVCYLRVSTQEQADEGYSIRAQRTQLIDYCRVNEYEVTNIYIDEGISAKDMNRPALKDLLNDAKKGLFDAVVVYKLDRFTRSARDLYDMLDYLSKCSVGFVSKQEKFDTTSAMGRLMIGVIAVIAQFERELIAERVRMGQEQKVKEGKKPGGKHAYGYDKEGNLIPEEAQTIRRLRELYMEGKLGFKSIAIQLNREGLLRRGFDWRASTAALTLENPFYAGIVQFGGKMANGKYPARKRELRVDVLRSYGSHEAIFTEEEYNTHLSLMRKRSDAGYSRKKDYWFSGLLRCGRCGQAMHGRLTTKAVAGTTQRTPHYICSQRKENDKCTMPIFRQTHLWHMVSEHIKGLSEEKELTAEQQRDLKKKSESVDKVVNKLKREQSDIKERVKKWQYMFVEGLITATDLRKRLDEETTRENEINNEIEALRTREKESPAIQSQLFGMMELWPVLEDLDKKEILAEIFEEIEVHTDQVKPKGVKNKFFDAHIKIKYKQ